MVTMMSPGEREQLTTRLQEIEHELNQIQTWIVSKGGLTSTIGQRGRHRLSMAVYRLGQARSDLWLALKKEET